MKEISLVNEIKSIISYSDQRKLRYSRDIEWLNTWEKLWITDRIRVGVIGVTSSGKSTLINALLGDDLLSIAVRPSSSQLVSCSYAQERAATVYFLNGERRCLQDSPLLKQSIVEYSDESYNEKNYKQVAQLELSTPNFDLGKDVLLVDSPGLDATGYEIHEQLTLETLLPTVDVVIFVTTVKSEVDKKMKQTLDTIAKYDCPIMVVQNMLDAVRPSIDGKKSAEDVARERLNRVYLAVEQSKIKNKKDVRVAQISAIAAMEYRCHKGHTKDLVQKYKKSNYDEFLSGVKELIDSKRPDIERQRVKTIINHFEDLIREEDNRTRNVSTAMPVDTSLTNISNDVSAALNKTYSDIHKVITALEALYDKLFEDGKKPSKSAGGFISGLMASSLFNYNKSTISEEDIHEIKRVAKNFESTVVNSIREFSTKCSSAIKALNLPTRDLWSYNGLPRMPEVEVKTKLVEKSRIVDKPGVGNWFLRGISNRHWGTEIKYYTETVVDKEATKASAQRYIERLLFEYGKTLEAWESNAKSTVSSIKQEIELRLAAIREKEQQVLDAADWRKAKEELRLCIDKYGEPIDDSSDISGGKVQIDWAPEVHTKQIKAPRSLIHLHNAAERYINAIQSATFNYGIKIKNRAEKQAIVISNSMDNLAEFLYRFYQIEKSDYSKETIYQLKDDLQAVYAPSKNQIKTMKSMGKEANIFLLINGLQFHTESETMLRKQVYENLNQQDAIFFVIQDFDVLANGNAITESLRTIRLEQKNSAVCNNGLAMINHKNPLYNLAFIQAQTTEGKLKEETSFYNSISAVFPALVDESVKKRMNSILRS